MTASSVNKHVASARSKLDAVAKARRRLRIALVLFSCAVLMPLTLLLLHIHRSFKGETFSQYLEHARSVARAMNQQINQVLDPEELRPFSEYSFLNIVKSPFVLSEEVTYSPLARSMHNRYLPGLLGYFQINPDESIHSPLLPSKDIEAFLSKKYSLDFDDKRERVLLWNHLKSIVAGELLVAGSKDVYPINSRKEDIQIFGEIFPQFSEEIADSAFEEDEIIAEPGAFSDVLSNFKRISFEGIIEDFQVRSIQGTKLLFFRNVWQEDQRYIQGFVVDQRAFFEHLVDLMVHSTKRGSEIKVQVLKSDRLLETYYPADEYEEEATFDDELLLHKFDLDEPFVDFNVLFTLQELPKGKGITIVFQLVVVLVLVLLWGIFGIYQLGMSHLELAQERSDFVSAVTHELKSPLTSIRMYGEMLRSDVVKDDEKRKSYYDFIYSESERLSRLINNMLYLIRVSSNESEISSAEYSITEVLERIKATVKAQVEHAGFVLEVDKEDAEENAEFSVTLDLDALSRIYINLVDNALKFSKEAENKTIEIGLRLLSVEKEESDRLVFYVRDYGPGVEEEQKKKIFDLFYRGEDELTRATHGTGIGLALVRELVEGMGAKIELINHEPGAEFQVIFQSSTIV